MPDELHPSWQTTDDETAVPVRAAKDSSKEKTESRSSAPPSGALDTTTLSRRPAAVAGILLVVVMAVLFYRGVENLTGQIAGGTQIRIAEAGLQPADITVSPGQQISWVNERSVPQYIISDTLCNADGECLNTPTLFQGDTASYTIPQDVADGTYTYFSPTDPALTGTITIGAGGGAPAVPPPQNTGTQTQNTAPQTIPGQTQTPPPPAGGDDTVDAFTFAQQNLLESIQRQLELDQAEQQGQNTELPPEPEPVPETRAGGVPQNPYTIGSNRQFPFDSEGNPIASAFGDETPETPSRRTPERETPPTFNSGTVQKPFRQPDTGPGLWFVAGMSMAGIWLFSRRSLSAYRIVR